ncbi:hypothetical protein ACFQ1S_40945, partial [Kibdelosporangium lantanae]
EPDGPFAVARTGTGAHLDEVRQEQVRTSSVTKGGQPIADVGGEPRVSRNGQRKSPCVTPTAKPPA